MQQYYFITHNLSLRIEIYAELPPNDEELITDIVYPAVGDTQVTIPANAIIYQRHVEGIQKFYI